jgi:hypothetical protein
MKNLRRFILFFILTQVHLFALAQPCPSDGSLQSITYQKTGGNEYLTFKFKTTCTTPTLSITHPPFTEDPTGNTITVAGSKFIEILFMSLEWTCAVPLYKLSPITTSSKLRAIKKTGQFEGVFTYVLGLKNTANIAQVLPNRTSGGYCYIKYLIF